MILFKLLEILTFQNLLAADDCHLERHPDLLFKSGVDDAPETLPSLDLLIQDTEGNVFNDCHAVQLVVYVYLLVDSINQELVDLSWHIGWVLVLVPLNHLIVGHKVSSECVFVDNLVHLARLEV
jgi:hypothetical protein